MGHILAALTHQNALVMRLILQNGMRVSDALELRTAQIKPSGWYVEKKTGKRRRYGIPLPLREAILAQAGDVWAFPGRKPGTHKTRQAVWMDVKRAQKAFRMPANVGTHTARKIYAVELMRRYGQIERVRRALNHADVATTMIYAMADALVARRFSQLPAWWRSR